jgi:hypothetical protein
MPGPGAKGYGDTAIRNFEEWKKIRVNMDTLCENFTPDTSFDFFGYTMKYPIFAGPVGAVNLHYGDLMDDVAYNDLLVSGCADAGILAFTGDGTNPAVMQAASKAIARAGGKAVPTVKPWDVHTLKEKFALVRESGSFAVAMDVDAAGLPFLQNLNPPAGSKTTEELREIIKASGKPFIVKGIMTVKGAKKALNVSWKKQTKKVSGVGVTGYEVQACPNKGFDKECRSVKVKGAKKTKATVKKLMAKKNYYVRVRCYTRTGAATYYSKWSKLKKAKTA